MSTQKMSYFSDIDLATLHRSRLNERIQYKLSWFNRRQKYCVPAATKRNHAPPTTETQKIKPYANNTHKFNTSTKNVCQPINGVNEMKAPSLNGSDHAKCATTAKNRQRKSGYTSDTGSKKKTSAALNNSSERLNHLDASTTLANEIVYVKHNEPAIPNGTHKTNRLLVKNNKNNDNNNNDKRSTCTDQFTLKDSNVNTSTRQNSVGSINRTAPTRDVGSNKRNGIPSAAGANIVPPAIVEQIAAIEEEDLELPHRKRSGTWP